MTAPDVSFFYLPTTVVSAVPGSEEGRVGGDGVFLYKKLIWMCRSKGSHFHDWIDNNEVVFFNTVTRMWSHIFGILG